MGSDMRSSTDTRPAGRDSFADSGNDDNDDDDNDDGGAAAATADVDVDVDAGVSIVDEDCGVCDASVCASEADSESWISKVFSLATISLTVGVWMMSCVYMKEKRHNCLGKKKNGKQVS